MWLEVATGTEIRTFHDGKGIDTRPAFRPDGQLVASTTVYDTISIWDAATGQSVRSLTDPTAGIIRAVDFSPDGTRLASIGDDGRAKIWDLSTGRPVLALRVADQNGYSVRTAPTACIWSRPMRRDVPSNRWGRRRPLHAGVQGNRQAVSGRRPIDEATSQRGVS